MPWDSINMNWHLLAITSTVATVASPVKVDTNAHCTGCNTAVRGYEEGLQANRGPELLYCLLTTSW